MCVGTILLLGLLMGCGEPTPLAGTREDGAVTSGAGGASPTGAGGGGGSAPDGAIAKIVADAGAGGGATWTNIYATLLANPGYASNCTGAACHDPGTQKGIDFSSKDAGYRTLKSRIAPGAPQSSELVQVLQSGSMPVARPRMPTADVDLIRAWIAAGAQDN
jgi:hypothetical protein